LGVALRRAARYIGLWTDGAAFQLEIDGSTARFIWHYKDRSITESRHDSEMVNLNSLRFSQLLTDGQQKAREARFQHARPKDISEHKRLFGAPVCFRMGANELIFDKAALTLPLREADPELGEVLVQHAEHLLTKVSTSETLIDRAESALLGAMREGRVGMNAVCHSLGMSTRSLQRALKDEGVSFQALLANVRQELAERYLADSTKSIAEIAYQVGYAYPSEFYRAFRLWTGMAPTRYRRRLANGGRVSYNA